MPIIDKRDRSNWYNSIPIQENPGDRFEGLCADRLKGNEIRCGCVTLAKIPKQKGLISYKTRTNEYGGATRYVELITERRYDRVKKQSRNRRVCIGIDVSHIHPGMMIINEKYHDYFSKDGEMLFTQKNEKEEKKGAAERTKQEVERETEQSSQTTGIPDRAAEQDHNPEETKAAEAKEEEPMQDNDREIQAELDRQAHARDRFDFLDRMLNGYKYLVEEQVSRKQDRKMSRYQIRRINELLGDIRHFLREFEYTEYLQPAEEPEGEDGEGMSYSDMAVLLRGYTCVMDSYRFGRIWYRTGETQSNN